MVVARVGWFWRSPDARNHLQSPPETKQKASSHPRGCSAILGATTTKQRRASDRQRSAAAQPAMAMPDDSTNNHRRSRTGGSTLMTITMTAIMRGLTTALPGRSKAATARAESHREQPRAQPPRRSGSHGSGVLRFRPPALRGITRPHEPTLQESAARVHVAPSVALPAGFLSPDRQDEGAAKETSPLGFREGWFQRKFERKCE
jgi:hypothetical protein